MVRKIYGYGFEKTDTGYQILAAKLQTRIFTVNYLDMIRKGQSDTKVSSSGLESVSNNNNSSGTVTPVSPSSDSTGTNSRITTTSSADYWSQLRDTLTTLIGNQDGRKIAINPLAGIVIVQAMPDELSRVDQYLKSSEDIMGRQVILEAKILEVELDDNYRAGINWGLINKHLKMGQLGGNLPTDNNLTTTLPISTGNTKTSPDLNPGNNNGGSPAIPTIASQFGGIFTLGINYHRLSAFVELLTAQGNVQVLSSPRVSTTNNQKALIKVGTDNFFVTNVSNTTSTTGTNTTTTPSVTFNPFFSGIALDITPQINDDGDITLHIHPTISVVTSEPKTVSTGTVNGTPTVQSFDMAKSSIRESDNVVKAKNGQIVIIGGLMQDKNAEVVSGIPVLKDMPLVGQLFRQTRKESAKSELVILIRPIILNDKSIVREAEDAYARFDDLDKGVHAGGGANIYGNIAECEEVK
jgi:MSHA biogenesis protein MshL